MSNSMPHAPKVRAARMIASDSIRITNGPANFGSEIATFCPPELCKRIPERRDIRLLSRVSSHQHTDASYPLRLLRERGKRPRCRHNAADHFDELASPHYRLPKLEDETWYRVK